MQIKSITIQNFKGIRRKAVIPLAPVTMLFGANSSGKSSILHALIYLFEVIVNRNADPEYSEHDCAMGAANGHFPDGSSCYSDARSLKYLDD